MDPSLKDRLHVGFCLICWRFAVCLPGCGVDALPRGHSVILTEIQSPPRYRYPGWRSGFGEPRSGVMNDTGLFLAPSTWDLPAPYCALSRYLPSHGRGRSNSPQAAGVSGSTVCHGHLR